LNPAVAVTRIGRVPVITTDTTVPQEWWTESLREFEASVGQRDYPCHFGRLALARGELYATFFDDALEPLADSLAEFLDLSRQHLSRRLVLAAFQRPRGAGTGDEWSYAEQFWRVLQGLHDADTVAWPDGFPEHPGDSAWEYCFHGVPVFVFAAAPTYDQRASRNLGPGLVLLFQPRNVFDGIEGGTPRGMAARQVIRHRLSRWDVVEPHPDLGDYGDPSNNEWRQYFIPDDQSRLYESCPLNVKRAGAAIGPTPDHEDQESQP
jgi:FPC/CPF motif-containing protein YcgG